MVYEFKHERPEEGAFLLLCSQCFMMPWSNSRFKLVQVVMDGKGKEKRDS